ncbi:MAG: SMP-30/gluconolactonase/LRE family protein [Hyphomicrobiales bacterium]|uniref:SMP-30/gluconolactonase/LRE family protein n=1 Tax=Rhabdaerophilum calidifontis TaxID=2604328 RepID=UPI0012396F2D|nr:SMP-30/gluconolactonase/LRE family protein [Rhabdaerophilum calidifontis]MCA1952059.1 SMP-30/gluconolactonase/LRE family protein [Hyphomicrobiales bacterium]MCA1998435.1 SMP-30/gluconolactonase/LRE family protein [Hyphomicrobiales bacterium]
MSDYVERDPRFRALIAGSARLERLWTGGRWLEGPAWFPAFRSLLFSDIPNDRILRLDEADGHVSVFRQPAGFANGHTRDRAGRLVSCEHGNRRVTRTEHDGRITVLAERFGGHRFNSPNDVVAKSDGSIWFSDPTYGIDSDYEGHRAASEIGAAHVYRIDPDGTVTAVATDRVQPNGLAFSPDETILYIADTGATHRPGLPATIHAYPVSADGRSLGAPRLFATCPAGLYDGFRLDSAGNLWTSTGEGVHVHAPDGAHLGTILVPEVVANLCFGGAKRNRLFITATTSLYAIYLHANGA